MLLLRILRFGRTSAAVRGAWTMSLCLAVGACAPESGGDGDDSEDPDLPDGEETIHFDPSTTLMLEPSESAQLTVIVSPARRQTIAFELLTETPDFDGFLREGQSRVQEDGEASVELKAPTQPGIFQVRASLNDAVQAARAISVSDQGYGTVVVKPTYEGKREIRQWTASARANTTCEAIESVWEDGPLVATGSASATIESVPSGPTIAVTIRGEQLVSGCTNVTDVAADETKQIEIAVTDRPINVSDGVLELTLGVDSMTTGFASHLEAAMARGTASFRGEELSDAAALIARMQAQMDSAEAEAFALAAQSFDFVTAVNSAWETGAPITQALSELFNLGASRIVGPETFSGRLELAGETSQFYLVSAAGVPAAVSGFFQGSTWMVAGETGDTLVLGGALTYEPVRWLAAIADLENEGASTEPLFFAADCEAVAEALVASAEGPTHDECAETCLVSHCEQAMLDVWPEATMSGNGLSTLQVGMTGDATLTGAARVDSVLGSWVGRLGTDETSLKGPAEGIRKPDN